MLPVYTDIHIHTSENANNLNNNYDVDSLLSNIRRISNNNPILISLTDHNTINKDAYLRLINKINSVILGAELHIKKFKDKQPYHCHILFSNIINEKEIDKINEILDNLYEDKIINKNTSNVPDIEDIYNAFVGYDYMLLPHGGQSHSSFNQSNNKTNSFDEVIKNSIYHNQFTGFTSRNEKGTKKTIDYFKKLGISEFTNLLTCSDNYKPKDYPHAKDKNASKFKPTWILSEPSYEGLKLALSENSRLFYSESEPEPWKQTLSNVKLNSKNCNIDVTLTPGLNVIIGSSSSGKTLFVESLYNACRNNFSKSKYIQFGVNSMQVSNPDSILPHYINQNFISTLLTEKTPNLGEIEILNKTFPEDKNEKEYIERHINEIKSLLHKLVTSRDKYIGSLSSLNHYPHLGYYINSEKKKIPVSYKFLPSESTNNNLSINSNEINDYLNKVDDIEDLFKKFKIDKKYSNVLSEVRKGINTTYNMSKMHKKIYKVIQNRMREEEKHNSDTKDSEQRSRQQKNTITEIENAYSALLEFNITLTKLSKIDISTQTKEVKSHGNSLSINNNFKFNKEIFLEVLNEHLKKDFKIENFDNIDPENLHNSKLRNIKDSKNLIDKIFQKIANTNTREYEITTKEGDNFYNLSPGWQSAIILDIILDYEDDYAPIIIDQPEDNLAIDYINKGLIKMIKKAKPNRQIILVSHNATIPMIGDAQNIILCKNKKGNIVIKSAALESKIDNKRTLDYIAEITDGGKPSIQKRIKKYDIKNFKE